MFAYFPPLKPPSSNTVYEGDFIIYQAKGSNSLMPAKPHNILKRTGHGLQGSEGRAGKPVKIQPVQISNWCSFCQRNNIIKTASI